MEFEWDTKVHGERLRQARLSEEWSRAVLATRLGVSYPTIMNWEEGENAPRGANLQRLLKEFGEVAFAGNPERHPNGEQSPLAVWLRQARETKGWSRHKLAQEAQVSYPTIFNVETGETINPQQRTREKLERALGVKIPDEIDQEIAKEADVGAEGIGAFTDFDPHAIDELPNVPGIYVFYDISDRPVYVGRAKNIAARIKGGHEQKFWYRRPIVHQGAFVRVDDKKLRNQIESVMIRFMKSNAVINKQLVEREESDDSDT